MHKRFLKGEHVGAGCFLVGGGGGARPLSLLTVPPWVAECGLLLPHGAEVLLETHSVLRASPTPPCGAHDLRLLPFWLQPSLPSLTPAPLRPARQPGELLVRRARGPVLAAPLRVVLAPPSENLLVLCPGLRCRRAPFRCPQSDSWLLFPSLQPQRRVLPRWH